MSSRGKYRAKTLKEKWEILREVEAGKQSKNEIAKKHEIPRSTLSTYLRNKATIEDAYTAETFTKDRKRLRTAKHPDLETALLTWIKEKRSLDIPLSGPIIVAKAADFAQRLNISDFAASEGWFHRFRGRHDLVFRSVCGEAKAVDAEACTVWRNDTLQDHLNRYAPSDVFNADETALFFKLLPDKTITYKGDVCAGGKRSKERVTVLIGANMTGTEKLPLFVIGKSQKPRCFKNIRSLPTDYAANKKAWMTGELFKQWLRKLDRKFELGKRHVLLLVDNCSAHKVEIELRAIELAFLPANTTVALQPMDQGVIKNLKSFYRRHILERMLLCSENDKGYTVTLLTCLHMLVRAWSQVTAATIANCFRHCGFGAPNTVTSEVEEDVRVPFHVREVLGDADFGDYVNVDSCAAVCGAVTDDEIIAQVVGGDEEPAVEDDDDANEEDGETPVLPSLSQVMEGLNHARLFFSFEEGEEDAFRLIRALEDKATAIAFREKKQKTITDFFCK